MSVAASRSPQELVLLALGTDDSDMNLAVGVVFEALRAEALLLTSTEFPAGELEVLALAHSKRLAAFEELLTEYMSVTWRAEAAE